MRLTGESDQDSLFSTSTTDYPPSPSTGHTSLGAGPSTPSLSLSSAQAVPTNGHSTNGTNGHSPSNPLKRAAQKQPRSIARVNPEGTTIYGDLDREEFFRLVLQSLRDVGYNESADTLQAESGYIMESPQVALFRQCVLEGSWSSAVAMLRDMGLTDEEGLWDTQALIGQQKYLECLEAQNTAEALNVLRNELAPLRMHPDELHALSGLIMCADAKELRIRAGWDGAEGTSRQRLLSSLQTFIPPSIMIAPQRFASLLHQAQTYQRNQCSYHNVRSTADSFSLYVDHQCDQGDFPRTTTTILQGHTDEVYGLAWSHNGKFLASVSKDQTAIIWRIQGEESSQEMVLDEHVDALACVVWSLDDSLLVTSAEETIKIWNVKTGVCLETIKYHAHCITALAWLPDGSGFISGGHDKNINTWTSNGKLRETWKIPDIRITDLAISPDYSKLVVVGSTSLLPEGEELSRDTEPQKNRMLVFDLATKQAEISHEFGTDLTSVTISRDSRYAIVNEASSEIHLWDLHSRRLTRKFAGHVQGHDVIRSCFGGVDENFIVSGSQDGLIYVWNRDAGTVLEELQGHGEGSVNAVAWNPRNEHTFASCSDDGSIRIWESTPSESPSSSYVHSTNGFNAKGKTRQR